MFLIYLLSLILIIAQLKVDSKHQRRHTKNATLLFIYLLLDKFYFLSQT